MSNKNIILSCTLIAILCVTLVTCKPIKNNVEERDTSKGVSSNMEKDTNKAVSDDENKDSSFLIEITDNSKDKDKSYDIEREDYLEKDINIYYPDKEFE